MVIRWYRRVPPEEHHAKVYFVDHDDQTELMRCYGSDGTLLEEYSVGIETVRDWEERWLHVWSRLPELAFFEHTMDVGL